MAAGARRPLAVVHADRAAALRPEPRLARRRAGARARVRDVATAGAGHRRRTRLRARTRAGRRRSVVLDAARGVLAALPGLRRVRLAVPGRTDGPRTRPAGAQHGPLDVRRRRRRRGGTARPGRICSGRARLARAVRVLRGARTRPRAPRPTLPGARRTRRAPAAPGRAPRDQPPRGLSLAVPARAVRSAGRRPARLPGAVLRRRGRELAGDRRGRRRGLERRRPRRSCRDDPACCDESTACATCA